jgi:hypothetical protein
VPESMEVRSVLGNTRFDKKSGKYSITITFLSFVCMFLNTLRMNGTCSMDGGDDEYIQSPGKKI